MVSFGGLILTSMLASASMLQEAAAGEDYIVKGQVGEEVKPRYKYPFIAYFQARGGMCGGSIINERHILTAAHCLLEDDGTTLRPLNASYVVVGVHNIKYYDITEEGGERIPIEKFIMHPNYTVFPNEKGLENDIAILVLKSNITFIKDQIAEIELPTGKENRDIGQHATVIGWGRTIPGDNSSTSSVLLETSQHVAVSLEKSQCHEFASYGNPNNRLCGFWDGITRTLPGDSGGPLFIEKNQAFIQIGIVSTGAPGKPTLYTNVAHFLDWITDNCK